MTFDPFNFSTGWSYVIGGAFINFAAYDAINQQVYVSYTNGGWTIVPNVPRPFPQWTYANESALWNLILNSPAQMEIPLSAGDSNPALVSGYTPVTLPSGRNCMVPVGGYAMAVSK